MFQFCYNQGMLGKSGRVTEVYEAVKHRICMLQYKPETVLREADLAKEFNVSRTPVRQALQRLQMEGLVESKKAVGTIVTGFDLEIITHHYEFRIMLLEWLGQQEANSFSEGVLEELRALYSRAEDISLLQDVEEWWDINCIIHDILGSAIKNKVLQNLYDTAYYLTVRNWFSLIPIAGEVHKENVISEIREITNCIEVGDSRGAFMIRRNYVIRHLVQNVGHLNKVSDEFNLSKFDTTAFLSAILG